MNKYTIYLNAFLSCSSQENMYNLCSYLQTAPFNKSQIVELTEGLAHSGKSLTFNTIQTADIPSTGGPSSLSTIISPLLLKEFSTVPKLGIVGRPAGGIDVLAQIKGYNIKFNSQEIYSILEKSNYCHFISNNEYTPLDSILFKYRSENNFKNIPSLVISSLLSKKIAVGVKNICLDVRYSDFGNFGKSLSEAQKLSSNFKEVADLLGIHCSFYFSNNNQLMQPYIGRGESLLALYEYFNNRNNIWLDNHMQDCKKMVEEISEKVIEDGQIKSVINRNFVENIELQGGSYRSFEKIAEKTKNTHVYEFKASTSGRLHIDIEKVRSLIVSIQKKHININDEFPDPCGIIFYKNQSDAVSKNDIILTYRVLDVDFLQFEKVLMSIITIED